MHAIESQLKALMLAALAGDKAAYRGLLETLGRQLRRYYARRLNSSDANVDDLVQEALIAIHEKRETFDVSLPFTPWFHAIARYKLLDHLRRGRLRRTVSLDDAGDIASEDEHEAAMTRLDLDRMLSQLPSTSQALIKQIKLDGLTTGEIARRTGESDGAIRVRLHRALKALSNRFRSGAPHADR